MSKSPTDSETDINDKQALPISLAWQSLVNLGWLTIGQYILILVGFAVSIILARLLSPTDFGTVALASSAGDVCFTLFAGWSFSLTVLQDQKRTQGLESSAFVLNVLMSVAILLVAVPIAILLNNFYRDSRIGIAFVVFAVASCLQLLASFWGALIERDLDYKRHALVNLLAQLVGMCCSVLMALTGWGLWSLVFPPLIMNTGLFLGWGIVKRFRALWLVDQSALRRLFFMGSRLLASQSLEYAFTRFDNLAVGSLIGPQTLGYYYRAYNMADLGVRASAPLTSTFPMALYSKLQFDRVRLTESFRLLNLAATVINGIIAIYWLSLPVPTILFLYGEKWLPSAPLLQLLGLYALLRPMYSHGITFLYAKGMPSKIVRVKLIQFVFFVPSLVWAALQSAQHVALVVDMIQLLGIGLIYREIAPWVDIDWKKFWMLPLSSFALIAIGIGLVSTFMRDWQPILQLVTGGIIILMSYLALLSLFERASLQFLWLQIRSRKKAGV